jgi:multiple antibiotic resistance protein
MTASHNDITNAFLLVYAGLFPIVNPIGDAPIFLGLTRECTEKERNALALRVSLNSFILLLGSLFVGSYVLEFFGITCVTLICPGSNHGDARAGLRPDRSVQGPSSGDGTDPTACHDAPGPVEDPDPARLHGRGHPGLP